MLRSKVIGDNYRLIQISTVDSTLLNVSVKRSGDLR